MAMNRQEVESINEGLNLICSWERTVVERGREFGWKKGRMWSWRRGGDDKAAGREIAGGGGGGGGAQLEIDDIAESARMLTDEANFGRKRAGG